MDQHGRVIIAGLTYHDARSMITEGCLYLHDSEKECRDRREKQLKDEGRPDYMRDIIEANFKEELEWFRRMHWIYDTLARGITEGIIASNGSTCASTKEHRFIVVREKKKTLLLLDGILEGVV